jgi:hypothetical protein
VSGCGTLLGSGRASSCRLLLSLRVPPGLGMSRPAVRVESARSEEPTGVRAQRSGVSTETIRQGRQRGAEDCPDHSARPHQWPGKATEEERAVGGALRRSSHFARDDLTFVVTRFLPPVPFQS